MRRAGASKGLRWADGRRNGAGDLDERAAAAEDKEDEQNRSGQRLGNIAVVLSPPWLQEMLSIILKSTVMK